MTMPNGWSPPKPPYLKVEVTIPHQTLNFVIENEDYERALEMSMREMGDYIEKRVKEVIGRELHTGAVKFERVDV